LQWIIHDFRLKRVRPPLCVRHRHRCTSHTGFSALSVAVLNIDSSSGFRLARQPHKLKKVKQ
jgi:hypothetical protein